MKDITAKSTTLRSAVASAFVKMLPATLEAIRTGAVPKADPLGVSRVAGIQAAKQTPLLIPYCHQIPLDLVRIDFDVQSEGIMITSEVKAIWKTGVEMEALVSVSAAALTLYDMLKAIDQSMVIESVRLTGKRGGKSTFTENGKGLNAAVFVMSDSVSAGTRTDASGLLLSQRLQGYGITVRSCTVMPDDREQIARALVRCADEGNVDLICTTGGTGTGPRDVTPEATLSVIERRLEGVEETQRRFGQDRIPHSMLSRGVAGLRGKTLILNFPGSPRAVEEGIQALFPAILHVFSMLRSEKH